MKTILADLDKNELTQYLTENFGVKNYVASQVFGWIVKGADFDAMTNVSKELRELLKEKCVAVAAEIIKIAVSADGTQKFLFRLHDGNVVEGVLMNYKYGNTLCVSTQVGCRMGCRFCASTLNGLVRNLTAGEILGQVLSVNALGGVGSGRYVTNIVLMGSGEPLDNFDNVVKFIKSVSSPDGLNVSERNISLSTCGIVPKMKLLADMGLSVNLTVSLHNADNEARKQIMPVANKYGVHEVMDAAKYYFEKTGRRIIVEYTLISGQNDDYSSALKLASVVRGMSAHVNVIKLNPVKETGLKAADEKDLKKFLQYLDKLGVSATRRRTMGSDIEGACGQLRQKFLEENTLVSVKKND